LQPKVSKTGVLNRKKPDCFHSRAINFILENHFPDLKIKAFCLGVNVDKYIVTRVVQQLTKHFKQLWLIVGYYKIGVFIH
jgi:hypothetical protein